MASDKELLKPEEVGELAQQVVRKLVPGLTPGALSLVPDQDVTEVERQRTDAERRRRDEEALARDGARRSQAAREASLATLPPKIRRLLAADKPEATPAVQAIRAWEASSPKPRLFMIRGGVGVGKSVAAAVAIQTCIEAGRVSVSWHRPNDFVSAVLHWYDEKAPRIGCDLVVVDDIGRETKSDFGEALSAFLDDFDAPIVLTTNLTKEQIRERYDLRVLERMRADGHAVDIKGESRRPQGGNF